MKRIKLIIFFLTFLSTFTLKSIANDCPENPPCFGSNCVCQQWSSWAERMEEIPLTSFGFPTCTLWVFYCYRQCLTDPACVEINITYIQAKLPYCGQCESFIQWLRSGDEWEQARRGRNLVINLFRIICDNTWYRFLNTIPPESWPYCDQPQGLRKNLHIGWRVARLIVIPNIQ